jgi:hypothetical protein
MVVLGDAVPAVPGVLDEVGCSVGSEYCPVDSVSLDGAGARVVGCGGVGLGDPVATLACCWARWSWTSAAW